MSRLITFIPIYNAQMLSINVKIKCLTRCCSYIVRWIIFRNVYGCVKSFRCEQGSNLRGETPLDFKSNALTTRPSQLLCCLIFKNLSYLEIIFVDSDTKMLNIVIWIQVNQVTIIYITPLTSSHNLLFTANLS